VIRVFHIVLSIPGYKRTNGPQFVNCEPNRSKCSGLESGKADVCCYYAAFPVTTNSLDQTSNRFFTPVLVFLHCCDDYFLTHFFPSSCDFKRMEIIERSSSESQQKSPNLFCRTARTCRSSDSGSRATIEAVESRGHCTRDTQRPDECSRDAALAQRLEIAFSRHDSSDLEPS